MPADGRWDLIRRLKVKWEYVKSDNGRQQSSKEVSSVCVSYVSEGVKVIVLF